MGHNFLQRLRFIERNLVGSTILDIGCGEGQYFRLAKKVDAYYAVDRDERRHEQCRARMKKLELNNVELFESLDDLPTIPGRKTLLLTEVIEHNTPEDAFELLRRCLQPETRILLTTPNRDFNVHYTREEECEEPNDEMGQPTDDDNFRHEGHLFEFSDAEFREFVNRAVEGTGASVPLETFAIKRISINRKTIRTRNSGWNKIRSVVAPANGFNRNDEFRDRRGNAVFDVLSQVLKIPYPVVASTSTERYNGNRR